MTRAHVPPGFLRLSPTRSARFRIASASGGRWSGRRARRSPPGERGRPQPQRGRRLGRDQVGDSLCGAVLAGLCRDGEGQRTGTGGRRKRGLVRSAGMVRCLPECTAFNGDGGPCYRRPRLGLLNQ